jgi:hypothetical protein
MYFYYLLIIWRTCVEMVKVARYNSLPFKYAFFAKKFKVQDLLVEHVITNP